MRGNSVELTRAPAVDDPAFEAGYQFVERHIDSADNLVGIMWHGWMVRQAFWEGVRWERERAEKAGGAHEC